MAWTLLVWLTVKLVIAASFQGIQPICLTVANPNASPNHVTFYLTAIETPSSFKKLPTDLQIAIIFEYLKPVETLRLRIISHYHRKMINLLARNRCCLHCGPQVFSNRPKLQVAFGINHLQLLKAVFPKLPADLEGESVLLLCVLAYFINVPNFKMAASRIHRLQAYFATFEFFFAEVQMVHSRWQLFQLVSNYLHKMALPLPLQVLYEYCFEASVEVKNVLLEHSCAYGRDNFSALFRDPYFSVLKVEDYLRIAFKSCNSAAILFILDRYNLNLPVMIDERHVLRYFLANHMYDAQLAERIDFTQISLTIFNDCMRRIVIPREGNFAWLLEILQRAPEEVLNADYLILKDIFIHQKMPEIITKERQDAMVLILLALERVDDVVLTILKKFLPAVDAQFSPVVTGLASRSNEFTKILMLENDRLEPVFLCPAIFDVEFDSDLVVIKGVEGRKQCVLTKIVASLGRKVLESRWFKKAYLLLIEHAPLLHEFRDQLEGAEVVQLYLLDLFKVSYLDWFYPEFSASTSSAIFQRSQWSLLELSIIFLNPAAVRLCLQDRAGIRFFTEHRARVLELAQIMLDWVRESGLSRCAQVIYCTLSGEEIFPPHQTKETEYKIIDERAPLRYETVPVASLINRDS